MRGTLKTLITVILVTGICLALWKLSGGDVSGFFDTAGSILYSILNSVANFFVNVFKMFGL